MGENDIENEPMEKSNGAVENDSDNEDFNFRKVRGRSKNVILDDDSDNDPTEQSTSGISNDDMAENAITHVNKLMQESDLFDAEGSDEDKTCDFEIDEKPDEEIVVKNKSSTKLTKTKKERNSKTLKNVKDHKNKKLHLFGESQRILRESRVCLPYHQPEQKTLDYFLQRKKCVPSRIKPSPSDLKLLEESKDMSTSLTLKVENKDEVVSTLINPNANVDDALESHINHSNLREKSSEIKPQIEQQLESVVNRDTSNLIHDIQPISIQNEAIEKPPQEMLDSCNTQLKENEQTLTPQMISRRLLALSALKFTPRLSGEPNSVVDLDDSGDKHQENEHVVKNESNDLILRVLKHNKSLMKPSTNHVQNNERIETEREGGINVDKNTPGAQLQRLKQSLRAKIIEKREIARQKRIDVHALDNEEGFEVETEEEEEEEEEAELTDQTETDVEDEEEEDDIVFTRERKIKRSIFIDDEAEDDDNSDYTNDGDDHKVESDSSDNDENEISATSPSKENFTERNRTIELFPLENAPQMSSNVKTYGKEALNTSVASHISSRSSLETGETVINAWQPQNGISPNKATNISLGTAQVSDSETIFSPLSKQIPPNSKISSEKSAPIYENLDHLFRKKNVTYQNDEFRLSQFGLSQIPLSSSVTTKESLFSVKSKDYNSQDTDDLLSLCSGKFPNLRTPVKEKPEKYLPSESQSENADELLDLLSGKFETQVKKPDHDDTTQITEISSIHKFPDVENEDSNSSIEINKKRKRIFENDNSDSERENSCDEKDGDEDSENDGETEENQTFGKNIQISDFLDEEAVLSGSEVSSDEEEFPEDDVLEDVEDEAELIPNEELLREQVGRAHFKTLLDEDKRNLRLMQEMFLQDGDLHSDGKRERKFRWRDAYENSQDAQGSISDNEDGEDGDQEDARWRIERYERQKWINENEKELQEDCEMEKSKIHFNTISNKSSFEVLQTKPSINDYIPSPQISNQMKKIRRGSFLARSEELFGKFGEKNKNSDINSNGVKNSRNFVFAAISPPKSENREKSIVSVRKKPKLEPKDLSQNFNTKTKSVFTYL